MPGLGPLLKSLFRSIGIPTLWAEPLRAIIVSVAILALIMLVVMALLWLLRRFIAYMQSRLGPNRVGPEGLLQPVADATKLLIKEDVTPAAADKVMFSVAPVLIFLPAFLIYLVIPFGKGMVAKDFNIGLVFALAVGGITCIAIILAGWASNNKYSILGGMRSAAQLIAYEVPMVFSLLGVVMLAGTFRMGGIVEAQSGGFWGVIPRWFVFYQPLGFLVFFICALAELGHLPFDLPEGESELVAGYSVEYSGMRFALFYLSEFSNAFALSAIAVTLFFGGWKPPLAFIPDWYILSPFWFILKVGIMVLFLMWLRASIVRVRIDQVLSLGWKVLLPVAVFNLLLTGGLMLV
jgi:NADH-quinone oxidoreductase subunit H